MDLSSTILNRDLADILIAVDDQKVTDYACGSTRMIVAKGIEIMEVLYGHTSGYAIPTYVIDAPEGGGKVPILPKYLLGLSGQRVVMHSYEEHIMGFESHGSQYPQCMGAEYD